jgi:uncharacterized repeat protein (TIGR01451 family)
LWLTTPFPSLTEPVGQNISLDLTLRNMAMPPQRVELSLNGLPQGWTYEFDGGGGVVSAAMVDPDSSQPLTLRLTPPADTKAGSYQFHVVGRGTDSSLDLPVTLVLSEPKAAAVSLDPKLPALRGSPKSSFDFTVTVKNDSAQDQTYNLLADAAAGFQTTFTEQYGSQELTSIPLKAGESKDLKVSVKPPEDVSAGQYQVAVQAVSPAASGSTQLVLDVSGQPTVSLAGPEGRLSGDATAGQTRSFKFTVSNTGTAPARNVTMDSSAPSGWKVEFDPKTMDAIAPGDSQPVDVSITPSDQAIAGDFVVTVRANADGASDNAAFRVTVLTSTMWGIAGLGIIGAAVVALAFAVTRYGRR